MTIIKNQAATVAVTLRADGNPVAIGEASAVTAQLFDIATGAALFSPAKTLASSDTGSEWGAGVVAVALESADTAAAAPPDVMLVVTVDGKPYRFRILVELAGAATRSALFVRDFVLDEIRADQLYLATQSLLPGVVLRDDYLWSKIVAAESELSRTLRVKLQPTVFFPAPPTAAELEAIGAMAWEEDTAYDFDPQMYAGDRWGFFQTRHVPLLEVKKISYAYPSAGGFSFDLPLEWLQLDKKYGHVRIVPISTSAAALLNPYMMQLVSANRMIPNMVRMTYVAGLANPARDYPELVDVVKKMAVLKIVKDGFLPQSGSISADGLSQSMSVDMDKYEDSIDLIVNGPKGSNGGLMAAIHGVRMVVA